MAVRLHYRAERAAALTDAEVAAARDALTTHTEAFPFDGEPLTLEAAGDALEGAANLPQQDPFASFLGLAHWCRALTDVRRAVPGASWQVTVDDEPVPWDDAAGFGWPEQHDPATLRMMEEMRAAS